MNIGIIGLGIVGKAIKYGFEKLGHKVSFYDPAYDSQFGDVMSTDINFICVPTKANADGSCDTSIVEDTVASLIRNNYPGLIVIKSTVTPGTTQKLIDKYQTNNICFVPEFLRERCAEADFTENHDVCIIGSLDKAGDQLYDYDSRNLIKQAHGRYPKKFIKLTATEAEFCKYFNNVYNATLITFANSMYELCEKQGVDYSRVKNAIVQRDHITDIYLDCNENFRGFGGPCLPKDTMALAAMAADTKVNFFKMLVEENSKYKITVPEGMRQ